MSRWIRDCQPPLDTKVLLYLSNDHVVVGELKQEYKTDQLIRGNDIKVIGWQTLELFEKKVVQPKKSSNTNLTVIK